MTHKTAAEVGAKLPENLESVKTTGEPVTIESGGGTVAVLVSAEDFALFERLREEDETRREGLHSSQHIASHASPSIAR
jgi:prevent-host-death family protein